MGEHREDVHVPSGQALPWAQGPELDQTWSLFPRNSLGHGSGIRVTCGGISAVTGDEQIAWTFSCWDH